MMSTLTNPQGMQGNGLPKRAALGRGLSALIPQKPGSNALGAPGLLMLGIETLAPSRSQPRKHFDDHTLDELAASVREHGVLQPVIVRKAGVGTYEIVAGERRWRAAQKAGLTEVPAVLKDVAPADVMVLALVENLQRQDLNPIEEAEAFRHLVEEARLTQEEVAQSVGKDRTTVANAMRLLKLPPGVREAVVEGRLSMGHARALLSLADLEGESPEEAMLRAAREVMAKNLSVRATEALVRHRKSDEDTAASASASTASPKSAAQRDLEDQLRGRYGVKVQVKEKMGKGSLEFHFHSLDELDELLAKLGIK